MNRVTALSLLSLPPPQPQTALSTITRKSKSGRRRHIHKPGNEALCKYSSKACYEPRVVKRSGGMHRYCEHHRLQANRNQRRLEQRRRVHEELDAAAASAVASPQAGSVSTSTSSGGGDDGSHSTKPQYLYFTGPFTLNICRK